MLSILHSSFFWTTFLSGMILLPLYGMLVTAWGTNVGVFLTWVSALFCAMHFASVRFGDMVIPYFFAGGFASLIILGVCFGVYSNMTFKSQKSELSKP